MADEPTVPPIVNEDHLRVLLGEQHESAVLDYKQELNLRASESKTRAVVETAKDVAAMRLVWAATSSSAPTAAASRLDASHRETLRR